MHDDRKTMTAGAKISTIDAELDAAEARLSRREASDVPRPGMQPRPTSCSLCEQLGHEVAGAIRLASRYRRRVSELEHALAAASRGAAATHQRLLDAWAESDDLRAKLSRTIELRDSAIRMSQEHIKARETAERRLAELETKHYVGPTVVDEIEETNAKIIEMEKQNAKLRRRVEQTQRTLDVMAPNRLPPRKE